MNQRKLTLCFVYRHKVSLISSGMDVIFDYKMQWNLIIKMTTEVVRKFDMCICDIMLNHSYFPITKTTGI